MENNGFKKLNLSDKVLRAVSEIGFKEPSAIQETAIPLVMQGKDIIGQAKTGTGKTAAFGIPAVEAADPSDNSVQVLVLCPTRELAVQVTGELKKFAKYKKGINTLAIYGGQSISTQLKALGKGVQIVAGTPGRVMDHMRRGSLKLSNLQMIILDEADEMLDMGFREDIETILAETGSERQTVFFSATMPREIMQMSKKYQKKDRQVVKVEGKNLTADAIEQVYMRVRQKERAEMLSRLLDIHSPRLSLVFCNTKRGADELSDKLSEKGYFVGALHGDMSQQRRDSVMNKFRNGIIRVLVATDVAARGLDVDNVDAVFNFEVPQDIEYYVHRIGRTGRAGNKGKSFTFAWGGEAGRLKRIEKYTKAPINKINAPSAQDVQKLKLSTVVEEMVQKSKEAPKKTYIKAAQELLSKSEASPEEIIATFISMNCNPTGAETAEVLDNTGFENTGARESGMVRLFLNAGRRQKLRARDIIGAIAGESGIEGKKVGRIDIYDKFTFVEVAKDCCRQVLRSMDGAEIRGSRVSMEPANAR